MKKIVFILVAIFLLSSFCLAAGSKPEPRLRTGDNRLDWELHQLDRRAATPDGAREVSNELQQNYNLPPKQIDFLAKQGYSLGEIQYLAMLAKQSGQPVDQVAALHSKGVGWGVLAKRLGVEPSALRQEIVQEKKSERALEHRPEPAREMPKMNTYQPRRESGQGGRGRGRGH